MKVLFTFLMLSSVCFGQSKKDQIMALNKSIDSLNIVLATTRDRSAEEVNGLNTTIQGLNSEIAQLKDNASKLESTATELMKEIDKLKLDLKVMSKKNLELEEKLNAIELANSLDTAFFVNSAKKGLIRTHHQLYAGEDPDIDWANYKLFSGKGKDCDGKLFDFILIAFPSQNNSVMDAEIYSIDSKKNIKHVMISGGWVGTPEEHFRSVINYTFDYGCME